MTDGIELQDPACVPDTFVEGIGRITKLAGNCLRYTLFATRDHGGGEIEHVVVAQIVWPLDALMIALEQSEMAIRGLPFLTAATPSVVPN